VRCASSRSTSTRTRNRATASYPVDSDSLRIPRRAARGWLHGAVPESQLRTFVQQLTGGAAGHDQAENILVSADEAYAAGTSPERRRPMAMCCRMTRASARRRRPRALLSEERRCERARKTLGLVRPMALPMKRSVSSTRNSNCANRPPWPATARRFVRASIRNRTITRCASIWRWRLIHGRSRGGDRRTSGTRPAGSQMER